MEGPRMQGMDKYTKIPMNFHLCEYSKADPSRILVVAPYCLKNTKCPVGRFSDRCDLDCKLCDVSSILLCCQSKGVDFKVEVEGTTSFLDYLTKTRDKYDHLIALSCPYVEKKIGDSISKDFGLSGIVIPLEGNVCRNKEKYMKSVKGQKKNQTKVNMSLFLGVMEKINGKK